MKKILAILLIAVMMFSMTSCFGKPGKPELDLTYAKKNLKALDYIVGIEDDDDFLEPGVIEELEADSEDGSESLYIVTYKNTKYAKIMYKMLKQENEATIKSLKLEIKQLKYVLRKYAKTLDSYTVETLNEELEDLRRELDERQDNYVFGRKGRFVWYGTPEAVRNSKGK